jgi:hypothetical protein
MKKDPNKHTKGWNRRKVQAVTAHYNDQTRAEAIKESQDANDLQALRNARTEDDQSKPSVSLNELCRRFGVREAE